MTDPLISIIIPCYNAERYVGEAIHSALEQSYANTEVIVIDDGSTDGSLEVIRSFGDRIVCETGPNRGACAARNRGLELAGGEFIQFLDADDLLHPEKLTVQLSQARSVSADVVYCNWRTELAVGCNEHEIHAPSLMEDPVVFTLVKIIGTPGPLFPKSVLLNVGGFREELRCAQEYDLHLRLACAGVKYHHCNEVLVTVRRVPGSISSDSVRVLDQWEEIYWRAFNELLRNGTLTDARAVAFAARMAHDGRAYLHYGLSEKANARFRDAFKMHASGGIHGAYGRATRILRSVIGPTMTERIALWTRWLRAFRVTRKLSAQC
ncbi:MAG: glycosyltransferase family 2 protein [Planctomycetaceae bacterium]